jgi:hypothetical protein
MVPAARTARPALALRGRLEPVSTNQVSAFRETQISPPETKLPKPPSDSAGRSQRFSPRQEARQWRAFVVCSGNLRLRATAWWRMQSIANLSPCAKFPINGKLIGNFARIAPAPEIWAAVSQRFHGDSVKFPNHWKREFCASIWEFAYLFWPAREAAGYVLLVAMMRRLLACLDQPADHADHTEVDRSRTRQREDLGKDVANPRSAIDGRTMGGNRRFNNASRGETPGGASDYLLSRLYCRPRDNRVTPKGKEGTGCRGRKGK